MDLGLKGKVALVTGAGSQIGFGKGISLALASDGCDIIAADVDIEGAQKTAADIEALGRQSIAVKADITVEREVDDMVKAGLEKFGKIDILVNNAGRSRRNLVVDTTEEDWHITVDINLKGTWYCIRAVLPQMLERKSGKIINITSGVARFGAPYNFLYGAAKAGIIGLTKSNARELARFGICVNVVAPAAKTTMTEAMPEKIRTMTYEKLAAESTTQRMGEVEDVMPLIVFLASDESYFITGQVIAAMGATGVI